MGSNNSNNGSFVAIIVYSNADTDKLKILSDNKGRAGIYMWTHNESGKRYIGSAFDLSNRIKQYFSIYHLERDSSMYICNALKFHGYSSFSLMILEYIDVKDITKPEAKKIILKREQYYLDLLSPHYNILKLAGSSLGHKHSEETKSLISQAQKGRILSAETKALMSQARAGKILSTKTKEKMSLAKFKKIFLYAKDLDSNELILYKSFDNYTETTIYLNCSKRTLYYYVDKNKLYKNKWILATSLIIKE